TGVNPATTYSVLRELVQWELVHSNNTVPASYFIEDPLVIWAGQIKRLNKHHENLERAFVKFLEQDSEPDNAIIIKIGKGNQTRLIESATKRPLKFKEEINEVKKMLEALAFEAPSKEPGQNNH
ncbi:MAG: hypothetical protein Q7R47_02050, partial [Candidatus Diapherotrites archaeon]|nr:hypothetical protein [Candidatus Diapherotrites archaeon]